MEFNESSQLSEDQKEEFLEVFHLIAHNNKGQVSTKELVKLLHQLGQDPTEAELQEMIQPFDSNGSGSLTQEEFIQMMVTRSQPRAEDETLRDTFKVFDRDGDGFISATELRDILAMLGESVSLPEAEIMVKAADKNNDGLVDYEEFYNMMTGPDNNDT